MSDGKSPRATPLPSETPRYRIAAAGQIALGLLLIVVDRYGQLDPVYFWLGALLIAVGTLSITPLGDRLN